MQENIKKKKYLSNTINKLKKNYSYYSYRERTPKLIYSATSYRNKVSDIYRFNNGFFNKHGNIRNNSDDEKIENDYSLSDENEDLYTKTKYHKKFINIDGGEAELFQKYKNNISIVNNNTNTNFRRKLNSKNNKANLNFRFNKTNQIINHLSLNDLNNDKNQDTYTNNNKPIRLKYNNKNENDENKKQAYYKYDDVIKENEIALYNLNNKEEQIQDKINKFKTKFCFKGKNEDFIKYLNIVKIKAELVSLIEMLVNNGEKINKENSKECFNKLEYYMDYKLNKKRNLLKVYQYLVDKLLEINNLNKNDIIQEF